MGFCYNGSFAPNGALSKWGIGNFKECGTTQAEYVENAQRDCGMINCLADLDSRFAWHFVQLSLTIGRFSALRKKRTNKNVVFEESILSIHWTYGVGFNNTRKLMKLAPKRGRLQRRRSCSASKAVSTLVYSLGVMYCDWVPRSCSRLRWPWLYEIHQRINGCWPPIAGIYKITIENIHNVLESAVLREHAVRARANEWKKKKKKA